MGMVFPTYEGWTPMFPEWDTPNGIMAPVYAWRAYTNPVNSITSSIATPLPLSDIPASIVAMIWYSSPPGFAIRKTWDYGDVRPYTFYMPDGTTRTNSSNMSAQAYSNLVDRLQAETDQYPP